MENTSKHMSCRAGFLILGHKSVHEEEHTGGQPLVCLSLYNRPCHSLTHLAGIKEKRNQVLQLGIYLMTFHGLIQRMSYSLENKSDILS